MISDIAQSCPTLCDPMDCTHPGYSIHGNFQARILEWVAISFSKAWKWKVKVKSLSLLATPWTAAYQAPPSMGISRQEYWSGLPLPSLRHVDKSIEIIFIFLFLYRILYLHFLLLKTTRMCFLNDCWQFPALIYYVVFCYLMCRHGISLLALLLFLISKMGAFSLLSVGNIFGFY